MSLKSNNINKRLLTKDYNDIVIETFSLPEMDYLKYYSNIVDENYKGNPDIIQGLELAIENWINWYKSEVYNMPTVYECDEGGSNKILLDRLKTNIPLHIGFRIIRKVNKEYFDNQLKTIKHIGGYVELKNKVLDIENNLPEPIRAIIKGIPFPDGFEHEDISNRIKLQEKLLQLFKLELEKPQHEPKTLQKKDLSHRQIALIYQYENRVITESNAKDVLIEYKQKISPTSHEALTNKYRQFNNVTQRTGEGFKTANDIRIILPFLSEPAKEWAIKELGLAIIKQSKRIED
jgi:hypothetical protein